MRNLDGDTVRWGVIGAGDVCEVKSAPAMQRIADSDVVAVMRRNADKARDFARRHAIAKWYEDADELIADADVNAVYVATPPDSHKDLTIRALRAGKPVYVEKPMARNYAECRDMLAASETHDTPLYVAYYRRSLPHFVKARELIDAGAIGAVRYARIVLNQAPEPGLAAPSAVNWRVDPAVAGGGFFHDLASHQLDLLDFLVGPVGNALGIAGNQAGAYAADDMVVAAFEFESGAFGSGAWCFSTSRASESDEIVIVGSEGEISFATFGAGRIALRSATAGDHVFEYELPRHIQQPLIQSVVNELLGRGACASTGTTAARTSRVMDAICA